VAGAVERLGPRLWRVTDGAGRRYALRTLRPDDTAALMTAFERQSAEDREMRLLSRMTRLHDRRRPRRQPRAVPR
jgi:hypothetical protein